MQISEAELEKMLTKITSELVQPYMDAAREALDTFTRLEDRMAYGERVARLEARLEQVDKLEERVRELERQLG